MILALPVALGLAQACAPAVAPETLLSLAQAESGLDPLAIGINGTPREVRRPSSAPAAVRLARDLIAAGRSVDLGLGQINSRNLDRLGLSLADAFDPCRNLAASARVLEAGYRRADAAPGAAQAALRSALSIYNTGDPRRGLGNGYVARVTAAARRVVPALRLAASPDPPRAPAAPPLDVFAAGPTLSVF